MKKILRFYCKAYLSVLILILFTAFQGSNQLFAQITITANDFPHAGMLVVTNIDSTTAISPGSPGTGQVWDFSNLVPSYDDSTLYTMPGEQPGIGNYPGANLVAQDLDYDINSEGGYNYIFYNSAPSGWLVQGQELKISFWGISIEWHIFYQPPAVTLPLPFTYNSSNFQTTTWKLYATTAYNGNVTDSVLTINHTTINQLADASGTMITPTGSFEALRVYQLMEIVDSTFTYNETSGWVFGNAGYTIMPSYHWYANGIGEVGSLVLDDKKGGGEFSFFKSTTIVGLKDQTQVCNIKIFPVPAHDWVTIESKEKINKAEVYDNSGALKMVLSNPVSVCVSDLCKGIYFLKMYTRSGVVTEKFIKK